jgi:hypothetical protein
VAILLSIPAFGAAMGKGGQAAHNILVLIVFSRRILIRKYGQSNLHHGYKSVLYVFKDQI